MKGSLGTRRLVITAAFVTAGLLPVEGAADADWAVYKNRNASPSQVTAAALGTIGYPWELDSVFHQDAKGAWKKVCWFVQNGDLFGQRYFSSQIDSGQVQCDTNCNCGSPPHD